MLMKGKASQILLIMQVLCCFNPYTVIFQYVGKFQKFLSKARRYTVDNILTRSCPSVAMAHEQSHGNIIIVFAYEVRQ